MRYYGFILFALALSAFGQTETAPPAAVEQKKASVEGVVVHGLTGEPLRRVNVSVHVMGAPGLTGMVGGMPGSETGAVTDASGKFSIPNLEPGKYVLSAERNGFLRTSYGARSHMQMGTILELTAGKELKGLELKLMPQGVVAGRVLDDEGEPVQGSMIQLQRRQYYRGKQQWMPAGGGQSDDRGEFRVTGVSPGKYLLQVRPGWRSAAPVPAKEGEPEMGFTATYYPSGAEAGSASPIEVQPGQELTGLEVRMVKTQVFRVKGHLYGTDGKPVSQAMIQASRADDSGQFPGMGRSIHAPDGTFELTGLTPGTYRVMAVGMVSNRRQLTATETVAVSERNVEGVVLRFSEGVTIPGRVAVEGQEKPSLQQARVFLMNSELSGIGGGMEPVEEDGTFTLTNILPGKYRVQVIHQVTNGYLKRVSVGGREVGDGDFEVEAGSAPEIAVLISPKGGQLTGTVTGKDGRIAGATVLLVPERSKESSLSYRPVTCNQNGEFTAQGLAPGEYKVFAWEAVEGGVWQDPEFRKPFEGKATSVKVQENGKVSLALEAMSIP